MPDEQGLDEAAHAEKIARRVDDFEGHPLLLGIAAHGKALRQAIELVVAIEERVHGGVGDHVVHLPEYAAGQGEGQEVPAALVVAHEGAIVEDHGRGDAELVAIAVRPRRHAPGGDGEEEPALHGPLEPVHEHRGRDRGIAEQGAVEIADEQAVAHAATETAGTITPDGRRARSGRRSRAAEVQRLAAALPSHRARAQHVGAAEGILDELVRALRARQARPPSPQHRGEQNEAQDERGDEQESAHDPIPGRGESRASGGSRGPDR